jgi:hypothetical protein
MGQVREGGLVSLSPKVRPHNLVLVRLIKDLAVSKTGGLRRARTAAPWETLALAQLAVRKTLLA